jgi:uncharacterized protein (DUF2267 family)
MNRNSTKTRPSSSGRRAGLSEENRTRKGALNLEEFASVGNRFIKDIMNELHVNRNSAARIIKAVLHAVRDRLPPDDAIQFAQGLPMVLKAVFIDQYDISQTPVVIRHGEDFLDFIYSKDPMAADIDFPDQHSIQEALNGVFTVLYDYMDPGQIDSIKYLMGDEIVELIDGDYRIERQTMLSEIY